MEPSPVPGEPPRSRRWLIGSVWARAGLGIGVVEAVLVLVGIIPPWVAVLVAVVALAAYFLGGRKVSSPSFRQGAWAVALSQALVLFVPVVIWILKAFVLVGLAVVAAVVLVVLLLDR